MCTSVPQIDAMSTRIRTSDGVGSGIATLRTSVLPGAGLSFTAAFIVEVMTRIPRPRLAHGLAVFQLCISTSRVRGGRGATGSSLNRVEFRGAVSDDDEQVLPFVELLIQCGIARVDAEDRRHRELRRCGDYDHVLRPDSSQGRGAHLEVPAAEDETLGADRAHGELRLGVTIQEIEDSFFVEILRDGLSADDRVHAEKGLVDSNRGRDRVQRRTRTQEEEGVRL